MPPEKRARVPQDYRDNLELLNKLAKDSKLTEDEAFRLGELVKRKVAERCRKSKS